MITPYRAAHSPEAALREIITNQGVFTVLKWSKYAPNHHRILKIARTIADLEGQGAISPAHVFEAMQYRTMDRKFG